LGKSHDSVHVGMDDEGADDINALLQSWQRILDSVCYKAVHTQTSKLVYYSLCLTSAEAVDMSLSADEDEPMLNIRVQIGYDKLYSDEDLHDDIFENILSMTGHLALAELSLVVPRNESPLAESRVKYWANEYGKLDIKTAIYTLAEGPARFCEQCRESSKGVIKVNGNKIQFEKASVSGFEDYHDGTIQSHDAKHRLRQVHINMHQTTSTSEISHHSSTLNISAREDARNEMAQIFSRWERTKLDASELATVGVAPDCQAQWSQLLGCGSHPKGKVASAEVSDTRPNNNSAAEPWAVPLSVFSEPGANPSMPALLPVENPPEPRKSSVGQRSCQFY